MSPATTHPSRAALLLTLLAGMAAGCGEPRLEDRLVRYEVAVRSALRTPDRDIEPTPRFDGLPGRRMRKIEVESERIGFFDFLALQGCRLGELAGERMSPLGRQLVTSRRLIYELDVLESADRCIAEQTREERVEKLVRMVETKRRQLPIHLWNAVWAGPELESYLQLGSPLTLPVRSREAQTALRAVRDALSPAPTRPDDGRQLEAALEQVRRAPPLGPLLRDLERVEHHLLRTTGLLRAYAGSDPTSCGPREARLTSTFRDTWIAFVQPGVAALHTRARDELPLLDALYRSTRQPLDESGAELPPDMDGWHAALLDPGGLWSRYRAALEAHVAAWRPILVACEMLPATS